MHASGIGKALLAEMDEDRLTRTLSNQNLEAFTDHTVTDLAQLRADLTRIRQRGYSIDDEEKNLGMRCIAAPIFDVHGEAIAGISISGPVSRVSRDDIDRLSAPVVEAAQALSLAIGGRVSP